MGVNNNFSKASNGNEVDLVGRGGRGEGREERRGEERRGEERRGEERKEEKGEERRRGEEERRKEKKFYLGQEIKRVLLIGLENGTLKQRPQLSQNTEKRGLSTSILPYFMKIIMIMMSK